MAKNETIGSHYVWRKYIESFSSNNLVNVFDKTNSKTFSSAAVRIGLKNNIYAIDEPINELEASFLLCFAKAGGISDVVKDIVKLFVQFLNCDVYSIFKSLSIDEPSCRIMASLPIDRKNNQELIFTFYESTFIKIYERLLQKDKSFLDEHLEGNVNANAFERAYIFEMHRFFTSEMILIYLNEFKNELSQEAQKSLIELRKKINKGKKILKEKVQQIYPDVNDNAFYKFHFLQFLLTQQFRTLGVRERFIESSQKDPKLSELPIRHELVVFYITHIQVVEFAKNLLKDSYRLIFITNNTPTKFITSDQPGLNTLWEIPGAKEEFELYYPLSPDLAMLYTDRWEYKKIDEFAANEQTVKEYNKLMRNHAYRFVYCQNNSDMPLE